MNKKIIILIVLSFLAILGLAFSFYLFNTGILLVESETKPFSLAVNEKSYKEKSSFKVRLKKGVHKVVVKKEGYSRYETDVEIKPRQKTEIFAKLIPLERAEEINIDALGQEVIFPNISLDKKYLHYLTYRGTAFAKFQLDAGIVDYITPQYFNGIEEVFWSPNNSRAVVFVENNKVVLSKIKSPLYDPIAGQDAITKWVFDFETKKSYKLDRSVSNISWADDEKTIFYSYKNPDNTFSLYKSNFDGKNKEKVLDLEKDVSPVWVNDNFVFYYSASGFGKINLNKKTLEQIKDGSFIDLKVSGNNIAYIKKEGSENKVFMADINNIKKEKNLNINVFSANNYCFLKDNVIFAAEYNENSKENKITYNNLVLIDLENLSKTYLNDVNKKIYGITNVLASNNVVMIITEGRLYTFNINLN